MGRTMSSNSTKRARTVAILFGRGGRYGSQSLPKKNLVPLLGRPVMVYPLLATRYSQSIDRLYVSTDDDEIASIALGFGAELIKRPDYLATKEALMESAIDHAHREVKNRLTYAPEYVVILMCNAPNILAKTIDEGVHILDTHSQYDSVITVSKLNMFGPLRARKRSEEGNHRCRTK